MPEANYPRKLQKKICMDSNRPNNRRLSTFWSMKDLNCEEVEDRFKPKGIVSFTYSYEEYIIPKKTTDFAIDLKTRLTKHARAD